MKRFALAAIIFVLALTSAAFAHDFGGFTMDIAPGWKASDEDKTDLILEDGSTVGTVVNKDETASLTVIITPAGEMTAEDLADVYVQEFGRRFEHVSKPVKETNGSYSWKISGDGVKANAVLGVEKDKCMLVFMTGLETAGDEILSMLKTVKEK